MSIQKMTWVWSSSPYKDAALLIHLALADHANDEGVCWPSRGSLARKARCSERTVSRAIAKMAEDGYLDILDSGDGRGGQPRYRLTKPAQETGTDCPGMPETETPVTQTGTSATNAPYTEPSLEPSSSSSPSANEGEPTINQRTNAIARGFHDWIVEQTGKKPSSWTVPQLMKMLTPFLENGWEDAEVKRALAHMQTTGQPLTRQVIERNLLGIRPTGPLSRGEQSKTAIQRAVEAAENSQRQIGASS